MNKMRVSICRNFNLNKKFYLLVLFGSLSFFLVSFKLYNRTVDENIQNTAPVDIVQCSREFEDLLNNKYYKDNHDPEIVKKVLLISENLKRSYSKGLINKLESLKIEYEFSDTVSQLIKFYKTGRYSVIIFETLSSYSKLSSIDFNILKKYCNKVNVGIIVFALNNKEIDLFKQRGLTGARNKAKDNYHINSRSPLLRITKPGSLNLAPYISSHLQSYWTFFKSNDSNYEPVTFSHFLCPPAQGKCLHSPIIRDQGRIDGVQKVIFGTDLNFWLHLLLFIDALYFQSRGSLHIPLERYVLVDIDDVFIGKTGTRITRNDAQALLQAQKRISSVVENFKFNLGFTGKYFKQGNDEEDQGDLALLEMKDNFWWFEHSWSHAKAHNLSLNELKEDRLLNKEFAVKHGILVKNRYSVAPHHAGVYPVHEELYKVWKEVWDVEVTSTEEYPALYPARFRKGFIYKDLKVLPRQECGLYTKNIFMNAYPGGPARLSQNILGGELFKTILFNTMSIFMTHQQNYANDRLALFSFENVFSFLKCWTNLSLKTIPPTQMAQIYFDTYPNEKLAIWKNPCYYTRHRNIWSAKKKCYQFPSLVVIGPQKTGTTALHAYLNMHPGLKGSIPSKETYEEVQFFSDRNYYKGIDWYMKQFPKISPPPPMKPASKKSSKTKFDFDFDGEEEQVEPLRANKEVKKPQIKVMLFEKSANYFAEEPVPLRMFHLLPKAVIIAIFTNPSLRAYSWYQHRISHQDPTALHHSFHDVVTYQSSSSPPSSSSSEVFELQKKCLSSGMYSKHINKWSKYYPPDQLLIVDGERLRQDPVAVMDTVQSFLHLQPHIDYSTLIKYSKKKGFYCMIRRDGSMRCLGSGKGRKYPKMEERTRQHLSKHFLKANIDLRNLLKNLDYQVPQWLDDEIEYASSLSS